jgi:hypothetical protein
LARLKWRILLKSVRLPLQHPLSKPIPVYNVDGTANDAGAITDIADIILRYKNLPEPLRAHSTGCHMSWGAEPDLGI